MLFLETRPGSWGSFSLWLKINAEYCRYDFVLKKNILWFQRVSDHVLELGHYEKRVKGMHYSFWLFEKRHILYILSSVFSRKYTCTVSFLLLIVSHSLDADLIGVHYPAVCSLEGSGRLFLWRYEILNIQKSQHIQPQFDQLSFNPFQFVCFRFCVALSENRDSNVQPRFRQLTLTFNQCHAPNEQNRKDGKRNLNQAGYSRPWGEQCIINSHELKWWLKGL